MASSPILFHPSQVFTPERAASRIQEIIDVYTEDKTYRNTRSWELHQSQCSKHLTAFEELKKLAEMAEAVLLRMSLFFPDDVYQIVIAIIVCTQQQRDLLLGSQCVGEPVRFCLTLDTIQSMTEYLENRMVEFYSASTWLTTEDGRKHRKLVSEAIQNMQESLQAYTDKIRNSEPGSLPETENPYSDNAECGIVGLEHWNDLLLQRNFVPLNVTPRELRTHLRRYAREDMRTQRATRSALRRFQIAIAPRPSSSDSDSDSSVELDPTTYEANARWMKRHGRHSHSHPYAFAHSPKRRASTETLEITGRSVDGFSEYERASDSDHNSILTPPLTDAASSRSSTGTDNDNSSVGTPNDNNDSTTEPPAEPSADDALSISNSILNKAEAELETMEQKQRSPWLRLLLKLCYRRVA